MPSRPEARDDPRIEATARWAFQLSYFLLADRRDALSVFYQAAARFYVTALAQKKRLAKRPKRDVHKKLNLTPGPLLQYLIYLCAESYEDAQEREHQAGDARLTLEDMLVRYIKHLTMLYLEHNSFYAAVGQSCILFDFGTGQAGRLYETLVQGSPAHLETKGDYSVRDAKRELRRGISERFGRFLNTYDGARGEQLFVRMSDAGSHFRFVKRCLHRLGPVREDDEPAGGWHLPARFDTAAYDLAELQYDERNRDPSAEHAAELRRVHVVTHPCCWARLLRALRFNYSRQRMVLPEFNLMSDDKRGRGPGDDRRHTPQLSPAELAALAKMLKGESRRRKGLFASTLSVTVDGATRAAWSTGQDRVLRIGVERGARVLAISARDKEGDLLLAQYLLKHGSAARGDQDAAASVTLEGGQEFTFTVSENPQEASGELLVTIRFRETKPHRAVVWYLNRSLGRVASVPHAVLPRALKPQTAALAWAALLVLLLAGWWVVRTLQRRPSPEVVTNNTDRTLPVIPSRPESATPSNSAAPVPPGRGEQADVPAAVDSGQPPRLSSRRDAASRRGTSAQAALAIRDGGRVVSIDARGRATGLEGISAKWRREVESALRAGRVQRPVVLEGLNTETETLLGDSRKTAGAIVVAPVGAVVESDRPVFSWSASTPGAGYVVTVFDSKFRKVAQSSPLSQTQWRPAEPLRRGDTYVWKVTTLRGEEAIVSPAPPAPEARFKVLAETEAAELERARRLHPDSHLVLGVLYARAGLMSEAEKEFRALVESNPGSTVAQSLLRSVREGRRIVR
jgi:hypothetical protein